MTYNSKFNSKSKSSLKRTLRVEALEARQMLTAVSPTTYTVDTVVDDDTDNLTSLSEAFARAEDGDVITFADDIDSVTINENFTDKNVTIKGDVKLNVTSGSLEGLTFDGVQVVANSGDVAITDCKFTGEYENVSSVIANNANLTITNTDFTGLDVTLSTTDADETSGRKGEIDSKNLNFNIIDNYGDLTISGVDMKENAVTATSDRLHVNATVAGILNDYEANLTIYAFMFANNDLTASSDHGDVDATLYGIQNLNKEITGYNVMMFGNDAKSEVAEWAVGANEDFGISTLGDVTLVNATMLEAIQGDSAFVTVKNSIYTTTGNEFERGEIITADGEGKAYANYTVDLDNDTDFTDIFPAYDAENNTFTGYDFAMKLDSAIVNKGNNDYYDVDTYDKDVAGNDRINGETIEIGAVESNATALTLTATAVANGTDSVTLTWSGAPEGYNPTYVLKYTVNDEEEITVENLNDCTYTVSGLNAGDTVNFSVMANGDNSSYLDSDWASASCTTKQPLENVTNFTAGNGFNGKPLEIMLNWTKVNGADSYVIEYRKNVDDADWQKLSGNYELIGEIGYLMTIDGASENLDFDGETEYQFRIKAVAENDNEQYVSSDYVVYEGVVTTGERLVSPTLQVGERTDSTITLTWSKSASEYAGTYTLQYRGVESENWLSLGSNLSEDGTMTATVSELTEATPYEFRIMVTSTDSSKIANSKYSEPLEVFTKNKLDTPTVSATAKSSTITVTWGNVDFATNYNVTLKDNNGNSVGYMYNVTGTSCAFENLVSSTTYTIEVIAFNMDPNYVFSDAGTASVKTLPKLDKPTLTLTDQTHNSITVQWGDVEDATDYEVKVSYSTGGVWTDCHLDSENVVIDQENKTIKFSEVGAIEDILDTRNVKFEIRAVDKTNANEDSEWNELELGTLKQVDISVANFDVKVTSATSISVSWNAVTDATSYVLKYSFNGQTVTVSSDEYQLADGAYTVIIDGLKDDTLYSLELTAKGNENIVSDSTTTTTTWLQLKAPTLSTDGLTVTTNSIRGTLVGGDNAESYKVRYSTDEGDTWSNAGMDGTSFSIMNLESGATVQIQAMSVGSAPDTGTTSEKITVSSDWSTIDSGVVVKTQLGTPSNVTATDISSNGATITWDAVEGATSYVVIVMDSTNEVLNSVVNSESKSLLNLNPNRSYTVTVQAKSSDASYTEAGGSATTTFETEQGTLGDIALSTKIVTNKVIDVTWTQVKGATEYMLTIKNGDAVVETVDVTDNSDRTYRFTGDADTEYTFVITASAGEDYVPSTATKSESTLPDVELSAVIVKDKSADDATTIPSTESEVDETMDVYMEVWVKDTDSLVEGVKYQFTAEFAEMYDVSYECANGITLEKGDDNTWTYMVGDGYDANTDVDMLVRFILTVNDGNGVIWGTANEQAYKFNGTYIDTDVKAYIGDANDDGALDTTDYDVLLAKQGPNQLMDINGDGNVDSYEIGWLLSELQSGKTWGENVEVAMACMSLVEKEDSIMDNANAMSGNGYDAKNNQNPTDALFGQGDDFWRS